MERGRGRPRRVARRIAEELSARGVGRIVRELRAGPCVLDHFGGQIRSFAGAASAGSAQGATAEDRRATVMEALAGDPISSVLIFVQGGRIRVDKITFQKTRFFILTNLRLSLIYITLIN